METRTSTSRVDVAMYPKRYPKWFRFGGLVGLKREIWPIRMTLALDKHA